MVSAITGSTGLAACRAPLRPSAERVRQDVGEIDDRRRPSSWRRCEGTAITMTDPAPGTAAGANTRIESGRRTSRGGGSVSPVHEQLRCPVGRQVDKQASPGN